MEEEPKPLYYGDQPTFTEREQAIMARGLRRESDGLDFPPDAHVDQREVDAILLKMEVLHATRITTAT